MSQQPKKEVAMSQPIPLTPLKGLALMTDIGLDREAYESLRAIPFLTPLFPTYNQIQKLATKCSPNWKSTYHCDVNVAEINIQALMEYTARRLLMHLDKDVQGLSESERQSLQMNCKWGCDGTQQSAYDDKHFNIIQTSCMPQQLVCTLNNKIIWKNDAMWTTRYCRPIKIRFDKLTSDVMREETDYVKSGISTLKASKISLNNKIFTVQHTMKHTVVDEEICNIAAYTNATQKCYICDLTTKDFNNLTIVQNVEKSTTELLDFGLSIAHIRIRLLENLLHLSYKLPLKKWVLTDDNDTTIIKQHQKKIQDKLNQKLDLLVDRIKPAGSGTFNDGWASRKFFEKPSKTAEITGIQVDLIKRFKCILEVITCQHKINMDAFVAYTKQTAELYVALYPWCPMSLTLHKILMHTRIVIEQGIIGIGQATRASLKVQSKHFPLFKPFNDAEFSQVDCIKEILNELLVRSDPLITGLSHRLEFKKNLRSLLEDTREMLLPAESDLIQANENSKEEAVDKKRNSEADVDEDSEFSTDED